MIDELKTRLSPPKWSWKFFAVVLSIVVVYFIVSAQGSGFALKQLLGVESNIIAFLILSVMAVLTAILVYFIYVRIKNIIHSIQVRERRILHIANSKENLEDNLEKDFFNNLIRINFKYLDTYYLQTQEQANKSFLLCLFASLVGLCIITSGIVLMYRGESTPAYVATSAGIMSEFISAVFFYLYNKTILSMADYHKKLVITQNISLALKITNDLPEDDRVKSQISLVESLSSGINHYLARDVGYPEKS